MDDSLPPLVQQAGARARESGFPYSCEPEVGRLLATLAAHLPAGARVLELGTGTGAGTAWDAGLRARQPEVRRALLTSPLLTSVELDHGSGVILSARRA